MQLSLLRPSSVRETIFTNVGPRPPWTPGTTGHICIASFGETVGLAGR